MWTTCLINLVRVETHLCWSQSHNIRSVGSHRRKSALNRRSNWLHQLALSKLISIRVPCCHSPACTTRIMRAKLIWFLVRCRIRRHAPRASSDRTTSILSSRNSRLWSIQALCRSLSSLLASRAARSNSARKRLNTLWIRRLLPNARSYSPARHNKRCSKGTNHKT